MNKFYLSILTVLLSIITALGQNQNTFKYQAVLRDNNGQVLVNESVVVRITILKESENGNSVYTEEHSTTSNSTGLIFFNIGMGDVINGTFSEINWGATSHFIQLELNRNNSGFQLLGTSPLVSVPYAMHAQTVANKDDADADPANEIQDLNLEGNTLTITNNNNATQIDLSKYNNIDTDKQELAISGNELSISNGNSVDLSILIDGTEDADADPDNEIQQISISNDTIFLSNGGSVKLPQSTTGFSGDYNDLENKPTLSNVAETGNYSDLNGTPELSTVAESGNYNDLVGAPDLSSYDSNVADDFSGDYNDLENKPTMANVAKTGNYSDLNGTPDLSNFDDNKNDDFDGQYSSLTGAPTLAAVAETGEYSDLTGTPDLSNFDSNVTDDFSGDYNDLQNKPVLNGDASGELDAVTVEKIQGNAIAAGTPTNGQVLKWDGSVWAPGTDATVSGGGVDGVVETISVTGDLTKTITLGMSADAGSTSIQADFTDNVDDADNNPENELQDIMFDADFNYLRITGNEAATEVDLSKYLDNTDEQDLILKGDVLSVTNGATGIDLSAYRDDADADPTNEIQDIARIENTLYLTNNPDAGEVDLSDLENTDSQTLTISESSLSISGGNSVNLVGLIDDADADPTNEIQDITLNNDNLSISNGSTVSLAAYKDNTDEQDLQLTGSVLSIENGSTTVNLNNYVNDADADPTNEIQAISLNPITNTLSLSKGGGTVPLPTPGWGGAADEALFAVVNSSNDTVFAVYEGGVRIFVDTANSKAAKGGFAVASMSSSGKKSSNELFRVTPDSVRVYIDTASTKAAKGGFAVASMSSSGKGTGNDFLRITNDSIRMYVNNHGSKAAKGGFAVASMSSSGKKLSQEILRVTQDSVRIYIDTAATKAAKGGFAVASMSSSGKGTENEIMKVTKDSTRIYVADANAGFGVENTSSGESERLMRLTEDNYFIGHSTGINTTPSHNPLNAYGMYNSFLGYEAGKNNTTGKNNTFIGRRTGRNNTEGLDNVFLGNNSGLSNTTGNSNVFIGANSGSGNLIGSYNIFMGNDVGYSNTSGSDNIFIGSETGAQNTEGSNNLFMGTWAGYENKTGEFNVFIGNKAGHGTVNASSTRNVFIGYQSGKDILGGDDNVFIGYLAGQSNTSGFRNIFIGDNSGLVNTDGTYNTYLGSETGGKNNGSYNVCLGAFTGRQMGKDGIDAEKNTYVGNWAGEGALGSNNSYFGANAGGGYSAGVTGDFNAYFGSSAGTRLNDGDNNVMMGYRAGYHLNDGNQNVIIGTQAFGYNFGTVTGSGNIIIGYQAAYNTGNLNNRLYIENSSSTSPLIYGEFDNDLVKINGDLIIDKTLSVQNGKLSSSIDTEGDLNITIDASTDKKGVFEFKENGEYQAGFGYSGLNDYIFIYEGGVNSFVSKGGKIGIGNTAPSSKLDVSTNLADNYAAAFFNDGALTNRRGIKIQSGRDDHTDGFTNYFIDLFDGNGDLAGSIRSSSSGVYLYSANKKSDSKNFEISSANGMDIISNLQVVDYSNTTEKSELTYSGFIAEEVEKIYPEMVSKDELTNEYSIAQSMLIPILTKATQEQQVIIEAQQKELNEVKAELEELKQMILNMNK